MGSRPTRNPLPSLLRAHILLSSHHNILLSPSPVIRPTESLPSLSPSYISRHGSHPVLHQSTAHVQLMA